MNDAEAREYYHDTLAAELYRHGLHLELDEARDLYTLTEYHRVGATVAKLQPYHIENGRPYGNLYPETVRMYARRWAENINEVYRGRNSPTLLERVPGYQGEEAMPASTRTYGRLPRFARDMEVILRKPHNEAKGGWRQLPRDRVLDVVNEEYEELETVLGPEGLDVAGNLEEIALEAVDLANTAYMAYDWAMSQMATRDGAAEAAEGWGARSRVENAWEDHIAAADGGLIRRLDMDGEPEGTARARMAIREWDRLKGKSESATILTERTSTLSPEAVNKLLRGSMRRENPRREHPLQWHAPLTPPYGHTTWAHSEDFDVHREIREATGHTGHDEPAPEPAPEKRRPWATIQGIDGVPVERIANIRAYMDGTEPMKITPPTDESPASTGSLISEAERAREDQVNRFGPKANRTGPAAVAVDGKGEMSGTGQKLEYYAAPKPPSPDASISELAGDPLILLGAMLLAVGSEYDSTVHPDGSLELPERAIRDSARARWDMTRPDGMAGLYVHRPGYAVAAGRDATPGDKVYRLTRGPILGRYATRSVDGWRSR